MHKGKISLLVLLWGYLGVSAQAVASGHFESSVSGAQVTGPYENGKAFKSSVLFDLKEKDKLGMDYMALNAWGESASYLNMRYVSYLTPDIWVDSNFGASDRSAITARFRGNAMINWGIPEEGVILGAGFDRYTQRHATGASAVNTMAVKYLKDYPVALQFNASFIRSDASHRLGVNTGASVQYGYDRQWTVAAGGSYGRVNYELVTQPGTAADYRSTTYFVSGRYWMDNNWGTSLRYSGVTNQYYTRNEAEIGIFVDF